MLIEFNVYKIVYAILLFIFRLNKIYLEQILKMTHTYISKKNEVGHLSCAVYSGFINK